MSQERRSQVEELAILRQEIRRYMELFRSYNLKVMRFKTGDLSITLKRVEAQVLPYQVPTETQVIPRREPEKALRPLGGAQEAVEASADLFEVRAPLSGTFYRAPYPGADPFVKVGDAVSKGDVLCIVEAMKVMNEITSPVDGVVREIVPQNGQPVREGDVLFRIELKG